MSHLLYCMVLILKPSVGLMVDVSSPFMRFTMVVLPALSRPLDGTRRTCETDQRRPLHRSSHRSALLICRASAGFRWGRDMRGREGAGVDGTYTMSSLISFSFCFAFLITVRRPIAAPLTASHAAAGAPDGASTTPPASLLSSFK